jgi:hypothetical protein
MADLTGSVTIDAIDLWTGFKTGIRMGKTELLKFASRKASIEYNWGGEDGIEVDSLTPKFDGKNITLQCFTICDTRTEFLTHRDNLIYQLMQPGLHTLRVRAQGMLRYYSVLYKSCETYAAVIPLTDDDNGNAVNAHTFNLILMEPVPQYNNVSSLITEENGRFIVT